MLPKVTIITPTYNRAPLLKLAMQSVLSQNYENLQFTIIDDASTDNTVEMVREFQQLYPDIITYIRNEQNLGESNSINRGWEKAEGKYVATLSDDDIYLPNWFEKTIPFMEQHSTIIVGYPDWHLIDEDGNKIRTTTMPEYSFLRLFATCASAPGPGVIIRKSLVTGMALLRDPKYTYLPDYCMWATLATIADFARIPHITACWRSHQQSITVSADLLRKAVEMETMMKDFLAQNVQTPLVRQSAKKLQTKNLFQIFFMLLKGHKFPLAAKYALRAFLKSPYWSCIIAWCYVKRVLSGLRSKLFS